MGGRPPDVNDTEILQTFLESMDPVLSGKEVGDHVGLGQQGAYQRLKDLKGRNLVRSKMIGRSLAWWITEKGREVLEGDLEASELEGEDS